MKIFFPERGIMNTRVRNSVEPGGICRRAVAGIVCGALIGLLVCAAVPQSRAAEGSADPATMARQLQLEGARLQLQGQLEEAVKKYRESRALQPNPRLDDLIGQLESKMGGQAADSAAVAVQPANTSVAVVPEQPAAAPPATTTVPPAVTMESKTPQTVDAPPALPQRHPASPQEELIYAFIDWFITLFPAPAPGKDFSVQTNYQYAITPTGAAFEVRLQPFTLQFDGGDTLELGPVVFRCTPQGGGTLAVSLQLPSKAPVMSAGKVDAELSIGSQQLNGVWNRQLANFDSFDLQLSDLALEDAAKQGRLTLAGISASSGHSEEQGNWVESFRGELRRLAFADAKSQWQVDTIGGRGEASGTNPARFLELRIKVQQGLKHIDTLPPAEAKALMADLDEYLQLFTTYSSSAKVNDIRVTSAEGDFGLRGITFAGGIHKEVDGKFVYTSQGQCNDLTFVEKASEKSPQPVSLSLRQIALKGDGSVLPIPPHFFADLYATIEGYRQLTNPQEADAYASSHGLEYAKKILALIDGYRGEMRLHDLKVVNAQPEPVTLEQATLAGGFATGNGQGGKIHALVDFSGFKGVMTETNTVPQAGRISLELTRIPSLLTLINDPSTLATGNMQAVQGQLMMNGMGALMQSGLTLSMADSFIAFPAARIGLDLLAQVDQKAKYMSTGTLKLAIDNPEELTRIIRSFGTDPETEKMMASLTALANRTKEGGKTVDRIDAKLDATGKVFINAKDVTPMFFPPPPPPSQPGTTPLPTK